MSEEGMGAESSAGAKCVLSSRPAPLDGALPQINPEARDRALLGSLRFVVDPGEHRLVYLVLTTSARSLALPPETPPPRSLSRPS